VSDEDVGFNKDFPLKAGVVEEVMPGLRRVLCGNPSPFTFTGTVSYIVGKGKVALIDPGPDDPAHAQALLDAVRGETVTHVFVTHTHIDHSPNTPRITSATGAKVYADGNPLISRFFTEGDKKSSEAGGDTTFNVDVKLADGQVVEGDGWSLQAVSTPGHASNHMAFAWPEKKVLFSGDHVMGWSTSIVSPPDGSMLDYMTSLEKLLHRDEDLYFCGHGPEVPDAKRYVRFLQRHRKAREDSILHRLAKGPCDIPTIVRASYIGIDQRLLPAAGRSVFAHLEDLVARKVVATEGEPSIDGTYRLVAPLA
jgi:glyoxylase-like metal-dependent hydrolase (beta-lactamase superfamily II)